MNFISSTVRRPFTGGLSWILLPLVILMVQCVETPNDPDPGPSYYPTEFEPSLSPDREYVYMVVSDTITPANNGIWRAAVATPIREKMLGIDGATSPSVSTDHQLLAFIENDTLKYVEVGATNVVVPPLAQEFGTAVFIGDSALVGVRWGYDFLSDSLFLIDLNDNSAEYMYGGYDPSFVAPDTIVYVQRIVGNATWTLLSDIERTFVDTLYFVSTFDPPGYVRWPSYQKFADRLGYTFATYTGTRTILTATPGPIPPLTPAVVDSSLYDKSLIIGQNRVLYTGGDGRLYESTFDGSSGGPWWYAESPN